MLYTDVSSANMEQSLEIDMGVRREVLRGVHQIQLGVWGRCEPPSVVRGGAPEDFEINTLEAKNTRFLEFLIQCCYTKSMLFSSYIVIRITSS